MADETKPVDNPVDNHVDVEAQKETPEKGILIDHEVTWDGPDDPANPYNWPSSRKITIGIVCSISQLVTTMSASMLVPALDQILHDLGMSPSSGQIAFSVFFLGLGFAPFLVAPLSEMYGRKPVWLAGNVVYIVWNALCPVGFSPALMIVARLLSASGASVGITLTMPVLADMYGAKDRGKAAAIGGILPYIGPALGPIVGGLAAQHLWWPWLFWILSLFNIPCVLLGLIIIKETYGPVLLKRKARALAALNPDNPRSKESKTAVVGHAYHDFALRFGPAVRKPVRLLIFRPVIQLTAIALAVNFGIYCLVLSTFASLWEVQYAQSPTSASLHYIAIALGAFICAQGGGRLMDIIWRRMGAARPAEMPTAEYRVPYMLFGLIPGVAGLLWYAWAADKRAHWAIVDVGIMIFTCGGFMFSQGVFAYLIDEFPSKHSASASAASRLGTYVFGFAFPIFAPDLYDALGYGWGNSLLGFLFLASGGLVVTLFWVWGVQIRAKGRDAKEAEAIVE